MKGSKFNFLIRHLYKRKVPDLNKRFFGFTLIELLVVVTIIGILIGVAFTLVSPARAKARDMKRLTDLRQIEKALEMYNIDKLKYPLSTEDYEIEGAPWGGTWPGYMDLVPKDPLPTQKYLYDSDGFSYQLYARFEREEEINPLFACGFSCGLDGEYNGGIASSGSLLFAWGDTGPTAPSTGELPSGKQTYYVSSPKEVRPRFITVTIDPLDVRVGDTQVLTTKVWSETPIVSVKTETELDTQVMHLDLIEISKDETGTTFSNSWVVFDTHQTTYRTKFIATDQAGNTNSVTLAWSDACEILNHGNNDDLDASCEISGVYGLDGGNLTIKAGVTLTINDGATWAFNDTKSIIIEKGTPGGSIAVNGQIKKAYLFHDDADNDTYAPSYTMSYDENNSTKPNYVRVKTALYYTRGSDCCDSDPDAKPGQTQYFTTTNACGSWDYNCNGTNDKQYTSYYNSCYVRSAANCDGPCEATCRRGSASTPACGSGYTEYTSCSANGGGSIYTCDVMQTCFGYYYPDCTGSTQAKTTACR